MKKQYVEPKADISVFEAEDIITASMGGGTIGDYDHSVYSPIHWEDDVEADQ